VVVHIFTHCSDSFQCVLELATTFHEIEAEKDTLRSDPEKLAVLFKEMIQMCLWSVSLYIMSISADYLLIYRGNATVCSV
jgi:hypothetical protein